MKKIQHYRLPISPDTNLQENSKFLFFNQGESAKNHKWAHIPHSVMQLQTSKDFVTNINPVRSPV